MTLKDLLLRSLAGALALTGLSRGALADPDYVLRAGEVVGENLDRSGGRLESLMQCTVGIGGVRDRLAKMADPVPGGVDLLDSSGYLASKPIGRR